MNDKSRGRLTEELSKANMLESTSRSDRSQIGWVRGKTHLPGSNIRTEILFHTKSRIYLVPGTFYYSNIDKSTKYNSYYIVCEIFSVMITESYKMYYWIQVHFVWSSISGISGRHRYHQGRLR